MIVCLFIVTPELAAWRLILLKWFENSDVTNNEPRRVRLPPTGSVLQNQLKIGCVTNDE